jgi:hypothetical protein
MIIAHYGHRLPENYDHGLIRALTKERGPVWDQILHLAQPLLDTLPKGDGR